MSERWTVKEWRRGVWQRIKITATTDRHQHSRMKRKTEIEDSL